MVELVEVGSVEEFTEDTVTAFDVEGTELMGVKIDGKYVVTSRVCTHKYFDLTRGHYADGYVTCTLHTSTFDLGDGSAMNPPATEPIRTYPTEVKDGKVFIDIDE